MSEAVAKAERRDLRRTVGLTGLVVLDQHADRLDSLKHNVEALAARQANTDDAQRLTDDRLTALDGEASNASKQLDMLAQLIAAVARDGVTFRHMSLWRRLRWLFTGRMC